MPFLRPPPMSWLRSPTMTVLAGLSRSCATTHPKSSDLSGTRSIKFRSVDALKVWRQSKMFDDPIGKRFGFARCDEHAAAGCLKAGESGGYAGIQFVLVDTSFCKALSIEQQRVLRFFSAAQQLL